MHNSRQPQRSALLAFIQNHKVIMSWISIYVTFILFSSRHLDWRSSLLNSTSTILPMIVLSMTMRYWALPRLLHRNRYMFYFWCFIIIAALVMLFSQIDTQLYLYLNERGNIVPPPFVQQEMNDPEKGRIILHSKYTFLLLSSAIVVTISYLMDEKNRQQADFQQQQMQEQLKYLRAQINPHFLFNALNCIYSLTMMQDEQAPESVLKLSEMLRYVIDDCRSDRVPLTKEVKYIQNYIDFQRIRLEQEPDLTFDIQIADPAYSIPPMLLQPIIENCFKHSRLVDDPKAWIHITLRQNDSGLLFTCDNSKPTVTQFSRQSAITGRPDEERTGIGLMNVKQRLDMLFGDKCSLKVIEDDSHYKTVLHI